MAVPYRWTARPWSNIRSIAHDLYYGVYYLLLFSKAVWRFRSWDWTGLVGLLEVAFRDMEHTHRVYGHHLHHMRDARQLLICREACTRLLDESYDVPLQFGGTELDTADAKRFEQRKKQQERTLGHEIARHLRCWWD